LGEDVWSRFRGGKEGLLWYFRSLVEIFRQTVTGHDPLIEELDRTVSELERLANYSIKP
jgi:GTP pyrophosphokinase